MLHFVMVLLLAQPMAGTTPPPALSHQVFLTEQGCQFAAGRAALPPGYRAACLPFAVMDAATLVAAF